MTSLDWLTSRPIAHRGLHDTAAGRVENTPSAITAAVEHGFAIEVDVQETADHKALVFHDERLDRLTFDSGAVRARPLADLKQIKMRGTDDPLWGLDDLLALVNGRAPLVIEIKSLFARDGQKEFVTGIADRLKSYGGPVAVKSFDPDMLAILRQHAPDLPRGIIAEDTRQGDGWKRFGAMERFILRNMLHIPRTRPHFISYGVRSLPAPAPWILRRFFGMPVITWTVRTEDDKRIAEMNADQIVFEGFDPKHG